MIWTLCLFLVCGTYVITRAVFRLMRAHEERKVAQQRRTFDRILKANHPPAAPGFPHRRIG